MKNPDIFIVDHISLLIEDKMRDMIDAKTYANLTAKMMEMGKFLSPKEKQKRLEDFYNEEAFY